MACVVLIILAEREAGVIPGEHRRIVDRSDIDCERRCLKCQCAARHPTIFDDIAVDRVIGEIVVVPGSVREEVGVILVPCIVRLVT